MALYKIMENPGRREVDPDEELDEEQGKLDSLDKVKIVVAQLRAKAKREGRQVDYVFATLRDSPTRNTSGASGGTSIRLTEEQRRELAKVVGKRMYETGEQMSMGEALVMVLEENRQSAETIAKLRRTIKRLKGQEEES